MFGGSCGFEPRPTCHTQICHERDHEGARVFHCALPKQPTQNNQKIIEFGARIVTGKGRYEHVSEVISRLAWLTAKQLVAYHTGSAVFRTMGSGQPDTLLRTFGPRASQHHSHYTRPAGLYTLLLICVEAGRRRLRYRGVSLLNQSHILPDDPSFRVEVRRFAKLR